MSSKGTLTIKILGDASHANREIQSLDASSTKLGDTLTNAGKKMTLFATAPIVAGIGLATKAASDLNETVSKSNTVFGESGAAVEKWGDTAAEKLGQSKREALDAASGFGNMFVQLGVGSEESARLSMKMVELASDFASFHNADISQVLEAQSAAFRGEYDSIQRFIPTISAATVEQEALRATGKKTTDALTAQDKALAVQTIMLRDSGDALGDFARTQDSAANQTRKARAAIEDAAAELGESLLPLVAKGAEVVADLASKFGDLPDPVQKAVLALGGLVAAAGPLTTVAGNVANLASKFPALNAGALLANGGVVVLLGTLLAVAAVTGKTSEKIEDDLARAVKNFSGDVDVLVAEYDKASDKGEFFSFVLEHNKGAAEQLRARLGALGRDTSTLGGQVATAAGKVDDATESTASNAEAVDDLDESVKEARKDYDRLAEALGRTEDRTGDLIDAHKEAENAADSARDKIKDYEEALWDAAEALSEAMRPASPNDLESAALRVERAYVGLGDSMDDVREAQRELDRLRRTAGTEEEIARATEDLVRARRRDSDATLDVREAEDALREARDGDDAEAIEEAERRLRDARRDATDAAREETAAEEENRRLRSPASAEALAAAERAVADAKRDQREATLQLQEAQARQLELQRQGTDLDQRVIESRDRVRRATNDLERAQYAAAESARIEQWYMALLRNELDRLADSARRVPDFGSADSLDRRKSSGSKAGAASLNVTVNAPNFVGSNSELAAAVQRALVDLRRSNPDLGFS